MTRDPRDPRCVVSVFGSGVCEEGSDLFLLAYAVGKVLGTVPGIHVQTGGADTGTMKAVRIGVEDGGEAEILGVTTWGMQQADIPLYPDGKYPDGKRLMVRSTIARNTRLLEADVLVVLPGMGGTLIEVLTGFLLCWVPTPDDRVPKTIFVTDVWPKLLAEWEFSNGPSVWDYFYPFVKDHIVIVERPEDIRLHLPLRG